MNGLYLGANYLGQYDWLRGTVYSLGLSASQGQSATLAQAVFRLYVKELTAGQGQSATLAQQLAIAKVLAASQGQSATLTRQLTFLKSLLASQPQLASLLTTRELHKSLSASQAQSAVLVRAFTYGRPWMAFVSIDGVLANLEWMQIDDLLDETPNTIQLKFKDVAVATGDEVIVAYGAIDNPDPDARIFAGHMLDWSKTSDREYSPSSKIIHSQSGAIDYSWGLDRKKINRTYTGQTVAAIIASVMVEPITRGYTINNVSDATVISSISFMNENVSDCIKQLATLRSVSFKIDYFKDLHFPSSIAMTAPTTLDLNHPSLHNFHSAENLSQIVTRGVTQGDGSTAFAEIAVGATILPVLSGEPFTSGVVQTKAQRLTYSGMSADAGKGTTAAGIAQTVGSLAAAVAGVGGNLVAGAYSYKQTAVNADGDESEPGALASVTISAVTAPGAPSAAASGAVGNLPAATYGYKVGFKTKTGVTLPGSAGSGAVGAVAAPGAPSVAATSGVTGNLAAATYGYKVAFKDNSAGVTLPGSIGSGAVGAVTTPGALGAAIASGVVGNLLAGAFNYKVGYKTSTGRTLLGSSAGITIAVVAQPGAMSTPSATTGGALANGTYYYATTLVDASGNETTLSSGAGQTLSGSNNAFNLTGIPTSADGRIAKRRIYRDDTSGNGAGPYRLLTTINDNSTTTYTDTTASVAAGAIAPTVNSTGTGQGSLTSIPTSSDGRVTGRVLYRTKMGGSIYFELATINDNSTTVYADNTADSGLTIEAPAVQTADFGKMSLTSIPTSGDARVTGRVLYRTLAGGSIYFELATINDNSTTIYTDNKADADLTTAAPTVQTSDFGKMSLTGIPTSADARVTGRVLYRTLAGGSVYYELATLNENTTTTYLDNVSDDSLTVPAPTVLTDQTSPDNDKVTLSSIALGPAGTVARKIYRTLVGGSSYRVAFTIGDNTTTSSLDNSADTSLGLEITTQSEWRNPAGSTTQPVEDLSIFSEGKGWVLVGSQQVYFTGRSAASGRGNITGIPATGVGSLAADVTFGSEVICQPYLKGIPASGTGSILYTVLKGDAVNLLAIYDDAAAQAAFATRLGDGSDGVVEDFEDAGEVSYADTLAQSTARVTLFGYPLTDISYDCRDTLSVSGAIVHVDLPAPQSVTGDFRIQEVTISNFNFTRAELGPGLFPNYHVTASSQRYSLEGIIRSLLAGG